MNEDEIIARGRRARAILENEDIQQAMLDIDNQLFSIWRTAESLQHREQLYADCRALERIRCELRSWEDELTRRSL